MKTAQESQEKDLIAKYNALCEEQEERLGDVSRDFLQEWRKTSEKLVNDKEKLNAEVSQLQATVNAAVEAAKRAQLE